METATATTTTTPAAWVGCLACYNGGNLHGAWCDAAEAVAWRCDHPGHEEVWCFDFDGLPAGWVIEMSPAEFAEKASALDGLDVVAFGAYIGHVGGEYATADGFVDAYAGAYTSAADWAQEFHEECDNDLGPLSDYIDWNRVARDSGMGFVFTAHDRCHVFYN